MRKITLSEDVLNGVDRLAGTRRSRSAFIESVLSKHLREFVRDAPHARDLDIINRDAKKLNAEAMEVLTYQRL